MRALALLLASIGFAACSSPKRSVPEWPSPFPLYVSNHSQTNVWVLWTYGSKEERSEVTAGEDAKILPPFVTDSDQPIKRIVAIESAVSHFDLTHLEQSHISDLRFVVTDPATIEVYERAARGTPIMILKGEPNKPVQSNAVDAPRKSGAVTAISHSPRRV